jgi:mannitol 2-dehydrogenase
MVDCIVPATGPKELALARTFGIDDAVPVTHENFRQWVIEDKFCAGRPDWDKVGATFTDDVHAFEAMKLRLLNAGHQIIATPGELMSIETIAGTMAHPLIQGVFRKVETQEIVPHVGAVPGMSPQDYVALVERRFANPEIHDTTRRVAFDGSSRHAGFLHPIIREAIALGAPLDGLALVEALWARMCFGTRDDASVIAPNDPFWTTLMAAAKAAKADPQAWIDQHKFYGDLGRNPRFSQSFARWLLLIWSDGTQAALREYLNAPSP